VGGFAGILRNAIQTADSLTKTLQVTVTHRAWVGQDFKGQQVLASGVARKGIYEPMHKQVFTSDGRYISVVGRLLILEAVPPTPMVVSGFSRTQPIDRRDRFELPDGEVGPIMDIKGVSDPGTNRPYFAEITFGQPGG